MAKSDFEALRQAAPAVAQGRPAHLGVVQKSWEEVPWERPKVSSARKKARKLDLMELRTTEASASSLFALSAFTDSDSES